MDCTQYSNALHRFKEMLDFYEDISSRKGGVVFEAVRESLASRFEYALEISWRTCRRHLCEQGFAEAATGSPKAIMRLAFANALVSDISAWLGYVDARQGIAHDCAEENLDRVIACCPAFYRDACSLCMALASVADKETAPVK